MADEISESVPDMLNRLKMTLINAKGAGTDQGYEVYTLVAYRIVEKLERKLGVKSSIVSSFRNITTKTPKVRARKPAPPLPPVQEVLKCGRKKHECDHTRARRPFSCGKKRADGCYGVPHTVAVGGVNG